MQTATAVGGAAPDLAINMAKKMLKALGAKLGPKAKVELEGGAN